jgi:uncharacterized protein (DUF2236 family)
MLPLSALSVNLKNAIRKKVVALFNDTERGQAPVVRSPDALLASSSVAWRIHGDVASMMVGGVASLLLQMLHPAVLAGVWDHSNFRQDMHGRLRRTARFIALTTYGHRADAAAVIARVRAIHAHVTGALPDGTPYDANDPALLAWVHVTETTSFIDAYMRYAEPLMSAADQDRYFAEMAPIGEMLGAVALPRSRAQAEALISTMRRQLKVDLRTKEVARLIMSGPAPALFADAPRALAIQAAVDLLPSWAGTMHGLSLPILRVPAVRAGTLGIAQTLRWAFR